MEVELLRPTALQMWPNEPCRLHRLLSAGSVIGPKQPSATVCHRQVVNQRMRQEDSLSVEGLGEQLVLLGVFDGHGGPRVAQYCAAQLPQLLKAKLSPYLPRQVHDSWCPASTAGTQTSSSCLPDHQVQQAFLQAFAECDASIPQADSAEGGSTAVCVLVGPKHVWAANCGDSRAVIARNGQPAIELTNDHKPERPDEEARIREAGGHVFWNGGHRVMGVLSMSRAMGDLYLKQYGVIATPEVVCMPRTPDDQFVLLASDGLWGSLSSQEAVALAQECITRAEARGADRQAALRVATQVLIKAAIQQGSSDNITVILCDLTNTPASACKSPVASPPVVPLAVPVQPTTSPTGSGAGVAAAPAKAGHTATGNHHDHVVGKGEDQGMEAEGVHGQPDGASDQPADLQRLALPAASTDKPMSDMDSAVSSGMELQQTSSEKEITSEQEDLPSGPRPLRRSVTTPHHHQQPRMLQLLQTLHLRSLSARHRGGASSHPGIDTPRDVSPPGSRTLYGPASGKRSASEPPAPASGNVDVEIACHSPTKRSRRDDINSPEAATTSSVVASPYSPLELALRLPSSGSSSPGQAPGLSVRVVCMPHSSKLKPHNSGSMLDRSTERLLLAVDSPLPSPRHAAGSGAL